MSEVFDEWGDKEEISFNHVLDITLPVCFFLLSTLSRSTSMLKLHHQVTLLVISAAGFGQRIPWRDDNEAESQVPAGHTMSYKEAIKSVCTNIFVKAILPDWVMGLTSKTERIRRSFHELEVGKFSLFSYRLSSHLDTKSYMTEMVERRQGGREGADEMGDNIETDLFNNLLTASEEVLASGEPALSRKEVIGGLFYVF